MIVWVLTGAAALLGAGGLGVLRLVLWSDSRAAARARAGWPVRLPRQLTTRATEFDRHGRTGL
jgi:hypothetical protein